MFKKQINEKGGIITINSKLADPTETISLIFPLNLFFYWCNEGIGYNSQG